MYYRLKPNRTYSYSRTALKRFYRLVYASLGLSPILPRNWRERPHILVPELKLDIVMDNLKRGIAPW